MRNANRLPLARRALRSLPPALAFAWGCGGDGGGAALPEQRWTLADDTLTTPALHTQGLASLPERAPGTFAYSSQLTIDRASGSTIEALAISLPSGLVKQGFDHLGDIDAHAGLIFGGLEDNSEPYGERYHRTFIAYDAETLAPTAHAVDPGAPDHAGDGDAPWIAVSPDGTWIVTSEWDPQDSLLLVRRETVLAGGEVAIEAALPLDATLARIQGCDFDGARVLLCASDDGAAGRLAYAIVLSDALDARASPAAIAAHVMPLFPTPKPPDLCGLEEEVEGVDVEGDEFRILVIGTCLLDTHVYRYVRAL